MDAANIAVFSKSLGDNVSKPQASGESLRLHDLEARKRLALVARTGAVGFIVLVLVLHVVSSEFDPASRFISEYVLGDYPWLMRLAFFSLATAFFAIAMLVPRALPKTRRRTVATGLLGVTSLGIFLSGVFDSDPIDVEEVSTAGGIHDLVGILAFLCLLVGVFQLRRLFADAPGWASLARPQLLFAVVMLLAFLGLMFTSETDMVGVTQRVWIVVTLAWIVVVSGWLSEERASS
jgi:hypothetical membrane protein